MQDLAIMQSTLKPEARAESHHEGIRDIALVVKFYRANGQMLYNVRRLARKVQFCIVGAEYRQRLAKPPSESVVFYSLLFSNRLISPYLLASVQQ